MSKSGNGDIVSVDPEQLEAALDFTEGGIIPAEQLMPVVIPEVAPAVPALQPVIPAAPTIQPAIPAAPEVGIAPPVSIPAVTIPTTTPLASPAVQDFYGSGDRITQPDAAYYEQFPLPGAQTQQVVNNPAIPIYDPEIPLEAGGGAPFAVDDLQPYVDFLQSAFRPDMSQFLTIDDLVQNPTYDPTELEGQINEFALGGQANGSQFLTAADLSAFNQFDPTYLEDQLNELAMSRPMDTNQFLTMADLPTYDTSQFLTANDLPTYQQFDPTQLQTQIDELAMAQPMDTSQFLTSADLPTYQQFDPTALQQEIADLQSQIGLLGQAPTQTLSQAQPYAPILDFAVR